MLTAPQPSNGKHKFAYTTMVCYCVVARGQASVVNEQWTLQRSTAACKPEAASIVGSAAVLSVNYYKPAL
jgi:hypothetical protein